MSAAGSQAHDAVTAYARAVVGKKIVAGPYVRAACRRHLKDLREGGARGLRFDVGRASRAIDYFPICLRHFEGQHEGKPFVLSDWQQFIIGSIFGWLRADGNRRFQTAYIESGKGSGKTPMAAGIGLYCLASDGEASAEVYCAAVSKEQAGLVFRDASRMVAASPALSARIMVGAKAITHPKSGSFFQAVSSEGKSLDGKRVACAIIDEIHEHRTPIVVSKMRAGKKGRRQPIIVEITNSGFDKKTICGQHHDYSVKVARGVVDDDEWFAYVCALDKGDAIEDEQCWPKANPNLDISIPRAYLRSQVTEAIGMPPQRAIVERLNFCIWTQARTKAIPIELWNQAAWPFDVKALRGRRCVGGLDLARVNDLSSLCLAFPPTDDEIFAAKTLGTPEPPWRAIWRHWCPEEDIAVRSLKDNAPYQVWAKAGHLTATPGNATDYAFIEAEIVELAGQFDIAEIAFDRTFAGELVTNLMDAGLTMVQFGQGFLDMGPATADFLRLVKTVRFHHNGDPVATWAAEHVSVRQDPAGNQKPDKEQSSERIDPIVAAIMAVGRASKVPGGKSIYDLEASGQALPVGNHSYRQDAIGR